METLLFVLLALGFISEIYLFLNPNNAEKKDVYIFFILICTCIGAVITFILIMIKVYHTGGFF